MLIFNASGLCGGEGAAAPVCVLKRSRPITARIAPLRCELVVFHFAEAVLVAEGRVQGIGVIAPAADGGGG